MPELPEVQTVVDGLLPHVVGRTVHRVRSGPHDIVHPRGMLLDPRLVGRTISRINRRGKKIVFTLDDHARFVVHLGMTGQLTLDAPDAPVLSHTHLVLSFTDATPTQLRFRDPRRLGGVWWLGQTGAPDEQMGPEPLTMRWVTLARHLSPTRRAIKTALLDQKVVAGIGNIYADESLFEARIDPRTPACQLTPEQVRRLCRAIKLILRRAIRHRGSTLRDYRDADGLEGGFQKLHRVYDRATLPCRRCKTPINRIVLGGRSTHYCTGCQVPLNFTATGASVDTAKDQSRH